ncbi:MAG UNVERIFIED_CONTAM: hypothetical protein LVQ98_01850 [Rickettsiaceae bacterium]
MILIISIIVLMIISAGITCLFTIGMSVVSLKFRNNNLAVAITISLVMYFIGGFSGVATTKAAIDYWGL